MAGLTSTGFERKTGEQIFAEIVANLRASISANLNTEAASLVGNFAGIMSAHLAEIWEVLEAVYRSQDRNSASGDPLDVIGGLIGVPRDPATKSTVSVTVVVGAGFSQAPGTMVANVSGDVTARFVNRDTVASGPGGTLTDIAFEAETTGSLSAPASSLSVITNPISGWTSITNPLDAVIGSDVEDDQPYRVRQILELARVGSTTVDAIRADVLEVESVTSASVLENDTDTTDGDGLTPHSVEVIVLGGTDAAVATQIFRTKAGGIKAGGVDSEVVTDSQGRTHTIGFTRPTEVLLYLEIDVYKDPATYAGDDAVKAALVAFSQANLGVGTDVIRQRLSAIIMALGGVEDVDITGIDNVTPTVTATNYAIGVREIGRIDTGRITITGIDV